MTNAINNFRAAVSKFVGSCGRDYEFPAGGTTDLLTPHETNLLSMLSSGELSDIEKLTAMSEGLDWSDCYSIVIFGVRLAILSVRSSESGQFHNGTLALTAGGPKIDSRDALGALAVFEDCGMRLGIDAQFEINQLARASTVESWHLTLDDFFSRSMEMRTVDVMGLMQVGDQDRLTYRARMT